MKRLMILSIGLLLASFVASVAAQTASGIQANWIDYNLTNNNWDFEASNAFCANALANTTLEWRKQLGWTGFCNGTSDLGESVCGKCLKVTNNETGETEKVRIFDTCGGNHLDLDLETAFRPIDSNREGYRRGYLNVDYEFVDCDGDEGPGETNVTAYYTDYNVTNINWDLSAAHVSCAESLHNKSLEWRKKYPWTGYCGEAGIEPEEACGMCLRVTNSNTKAEEIVRVVDACGSGGLELDLDTAFKPIDTDGTGFRVGHLTVDYRFVDCGDSEKNYIVLVTSE